MTSRSGTVRLSKVDLLSPLVHLHTTSSVRAGCHSTGVVKAAFIRIAPNYSAPRSSSEGSPEQSSSVASGSVLAGLSLVFRPNISPGRLFVGDSDQEGPSVPGVGLNSPPPVWDLEVVGLAPEGYQLIEKLTCCVQFWLLGFTLTVQASGVNLINFSSTEVLRPTSTVYRTWSGLPFLWIISCMAWLCLWALEATPLGVCLLQRHYQEKHLCRMFVLQQAGPLSPHIH